MQEKSLIKKNILQYIDYKGISKYKFYQETGITRGVLDQNNGMSEENTSRFIVQYPNVSIEWLLTGQGSMLREDRQSTTITATPATGDEGIPLIPVKAMAGYANGDVQVLDYEITQRYHIPDFENKGVKFMIRASGSSMYPKYSNGDLLACRPVTDLSFFQWGKVYVLDTEQGPLVKRLFPCPDDDEYLECHSDNKANYPPFSIRKESIRKVAIVVGVIRLE